MVRPPPKLQHWFTDFRGKLVFCRACGYLPPPPADCKVVSTSVRNFRIESEIAWKMADYAPRCACDECNSQRRENAGLADLPPLHSAHTQHLHTLIGGWNRRAP